MCLSRGEAARGYAVALTLVLSSLTRHACLVSSHEGGERVRTPECASRYCRAHDDTRAQRTIGRLGE